jgi:hypothetical protein
MELNDEQLKKILEEGLAADYPDESVELGENWEIIAKIFFHAGYVHPLDGTEE